MTFAPEGQTFANRLAFYLDKYENLIAASVDLHRSDKKQSEGFELSRHFDDQQLNTDLSKDLIALGPHMDKIKELFAQISEKAILKKVEAGAATLADINLLRRKDLLAAQFCILALRKNEAVEDYMIRVERHRKDRELRELAEFHENEEIARRLAEEEARTQASEKVAFFVTTDNFEDALVEKTEELILADEIGNEANAKNKLSDVITSIMSLSDGRARLSEMFPNLRSESEIVETLIDSYKRAQTTTLD
jgi:hypothetical protein